MVPRRTLDIFTCLFDLLTWSNSRVDSSSLGHLEHLLPRYRMAQSLRSWYLWARYCLMYSL